MKNHASHVACTRSGGLFFAIVRIITPATDSEVANEFRMIFSINLPIAEVIAYGNYDYVKEGYAWGISASLNLAAMGQIRDTLAPKVTWTMNCDGSIQGGRIEDLPYDSAVRSNILMIVEEADSLHTNYFGFEYDNIKLNSRPSAIDWKLLISDPLQKARKTFRVVDAAGNDTVITVEYGGHNRVYVGLITG